MSLATEEVDVCRVGRAVPSKVTLSLEPGTLVGLVGSNGPGKTTLLSTLTGVVGECTELVEPRDATCGKDRTRHWRR